MFDSSSETPKPSSNPQHRGIWGTIMLMIAIALVAAMIGGVAGSAVATRPLPATMPPAIVGTIQQTSTQAPLPTSPGSRSGLES